MPTTKRHKYQFEAWDYQHKITSRQREAINTWLANLGLMGPEGSDVHLVEILTDHHVRVMAYRRNGQGKRYLDVNNNRVKDQRPATRVTTVYPEHPFPLVPGESGAWVWHPDFEVLDGDDA